MPLKKKQQRSYDKCVRFRERISETNFKREALIKEFAEFLRKVLRKDKTHQQEEPVIPTLDVVSEQTLSKQTSFPQRRFDVRSTTDTKDDAVYGATASPFLFSPNTQLLDTLRYTENGDNLKIGN